jgi:hypothetical protein
LQRVRDADATAARSLNQEDEQLFDLFKNPVDIKIKITND